MTISIDQKNLDKIIIVGDKALIKPKSFKDRTKSGLYLPPGVQEKEDVHSGYIIKVGPGFPIPAITEENEPWKNQSDEIKYLPLQAKVGDLAVYLNKSGVDIEFNKEKYILIPHSAILMLIRDDGLFD